MIYNLYSYLFLESVTQVLQFRIDLSKEMVFRFELDESMMPIRNSIFLLDVKELKDALIQVTNYLMSIDARPGNPPKTNTNALVEELLKHLTHGDFLTLFGDPSKYADQKSVTDFLLQIGHDNLQTIPGQHYLVNEFVHN